MTGGPKKTVEDVLCEVLEALGAGLESYETKVLTYGKELSYGAEGRPPRESTVEIGVTIRADDAVMVGAISSGVGFAISIKKDGEVSCAFLPGDMFGAESMKLGTARLRSDCLAVLLEVLEVGEFIIQTLVDTHGAWRVREAAARVSEMGR